MANTVSILSYANTFGDWVVQTNALTRENNDLAANNYVKPTGTLYLNAPSLGLQVANNAIVAGQLQVQGIGSSAYVQNNLRVDQQVYFTNTTLGLTNSGQANIGGPLLAMGPGIGLAVSNNATVGGNVTISINETVGGILTVMGNTTLNGIKVTSTANTLVSNTLHVTGQTNINNRLVVSSNTDIGGYVNAYYDVNANNTVIRYNTNTNSLNVTDYATISNTTITNVLQANSSVNTTNASIINTTYTKFLQANTRVNTVTLNVSGTEYVDTIIANTSVTTPTLTVSSSFIAPSATMTANSIQVGTGGLSVQGNFSINGSTVYNTNQFTLSALTPNQTAFFNVYRSTANASIRWNETAKYWDMMNVNNSNYYRMLTDEYLSSSSNFNSTSNVATPAAVFSANTFLQANDATTLASAKSYTDANVSTLNTTISNLNTYAQSAYNKANTGGIFTNASTFQNDLTVTGNLIVNGTTTTINTQTIQTNDSLIKLANGNAADGVDIGFYGQYTSAGAKYAGLIRQAAGSFYLLQGLTTDPSGNTVSFTSSNRATLNSNLTGGTVSGLSSVIGITDGGTNNSSFSTGQRIIYDGTKLATQANTSTTVTGGLATSNTITTLTYNAYGELTGYTAVPIAISYSQVSGLAPSATTDTTSASNISSGTLPNARLVNVPNSALLNSTISGIALGGTLNTLTMGVSGTGLSGSTTYNGSGAATFTVTSNATNNNTASTVVSRDASGNFSAGTITAALSGNASTATKASTLAQGGGAGAAMTFNWSGQSGQPTYLWGSNDGTNIYVWNPSNFSVNYANYAGYVNSTSNSYQNIYYDVYNTGYYLQPRGTNRLNNVTADVVYSYGNIVAYYSDDRLKTRLGTIENALEKVTSLTGFYYQANATAQELGYEVKREVGLSAQDTQKIAPEIIHAAPVDDQYLTIDYERLVPFLVEAIKELKAEIDQLKGK
jgi:hypothetical protein